jgi:hypothetical protein
MVGGYATMYGHPFTAWNHAARYKEIKAPMG